MIAPNVIIVWPGTHASIPAGFARETLLDGKHPKATADGVDPNVSGGAATHAHTSPAHAHTMISHSHSGSTDRAGDFESEGGNNKDPARDSHYHDYNIAGVTGGSLSDAVTYAATSSEPPYYEVIFIKAVGYKAVPTSAVVLWNSATIPAGFGECNGDSGRPDFRNKYLKGASTGGNSGGTGGTLTHEHAINHTHTGITHTHVAGSGYDSDFNDQHGRDELGGAGACVIRHTHVVTLNAAGSETGSAYTGNAGSADTVEPAYHKMIAIQNTGGATIKKGMIGMWLGLLADIPVGWKLCDGNNSTPDLRDKFIKIVNTSAELGATAGSNTHIHAASNSHTHTAAGSHVHTGSTDYAGTTYGTGANADGVSKAHSHTINSNSSAGTSSWNNQTVTADNSDGQPPFLTVAYIQFKFGFGGAAMLTLL